MKVFLKQHLKTFPKLRHRLSSIKWTLLLAATAMFFMSAAAPNGCNFMVSFGGGGATVTGPAGAGSPPATGGAPAGMLPPVAAGSPPAAGGVPPAGSVTAAGGGAPAAGSPPAAGGGAPPAGSPPAAGGGAPPAGSPPAAGGGGAPAAGSPPAAGGGAPPAAGSPAAAAPAPAPAAGGGGAPAAAGGAHIVLITAGPPTPTDASGFLFVDSDSKTPVTTIKKGTTVVWMNQTKVPHTVTADPTSAMQFDSGVVTPASKSPYYMMTFNQVGKFTYSCIVHPGQVGEIDVTA